jgi:hypothetical protein
VTAFVTKASTLLETAAHTEPLKIQHSADGKRRVVIWQRSNGNFGCVEEYWFENFDEGELIAKGWAYRPTDTYFLKR